MLAPGAVIFYTASWRRLGTKEDSIHILSRITSINSFFLGPDTGPRLRSASIAQKLSWATNRTTTRPEDIAYSLIGILDISMPLLYGEGMRAFTRFRRSL
jgi:hypothetical protein